MVLFFEVIFFAATFYEIKLLTNLSSFPYSSYARKPLELLLDFDRACGSLENKSSRI